MTRFENVKDAVPMLDAVKFYGFEPKRAGFICCPFHTERTPSLKVYERRFRCYGCGASGSVIDFVALLFNIEPTQAVERIEADFHLAPMLETPTERTERQRVADARRLFDSWREQMMAKLDAVIRTANCADFQYLSPAEVEALKYREACEDWSNTLSHGALDEQMQIFRDRENVERLCRKILNSMPMKSKTA